MTEKSAAELKREREMAARKALFVQGDARPENTDLSTILGPPQPPAPVAAPDEPSAPAEAVSEPEGEAGAAPVAESPSEPQEPPAAAPDVPQVVQTAVSPPAARKTAPKPAGKAAPKPAKAPKADDEPDPWADGDDKDKGFTTKFDAVLHRKMLWIADNVPRQKSIQRIVHNAVVDYVEKLLAEHYEP